MSHRTRRRDRARVHSSSFNRPSPTNSSSFAGSSIDRRRGILYWRATHLATAFTDTAFTAWTRLTAVWNGDGRGKVSETIDDARVSSRHGPPGPRGFQTVPHGSLWRVKFTTKNRHAVVTRAAERTGKRGLLGGELAGHGGAGSDGEVGGDDGGHDTRWVALSCKGWVQEWLPQWARVLVLSRIRIWELANRGPD